MTPFEHLVDIVKQLRGADGCPWDKAQTHKSLSPYAVEEAHELEEAIENEDIDNMKEELGDVLFQSVLHAELARQDGHFDINDVIENLNHKMVSRHPHVFSDKEVKNSSDVLKNWEDIKDTEKNKPKDPFDLPKTFPSLLEAHKIGKRTKRMDFDWNTPAEVFTKVEEELSEFKEAFEKLPDSVAEPAYRSDEENNIMSAIEEEMGDLLFTISQVARHLDLDAEKALRKANQKFIKRFRAMLAARPDFESLSRDEKERLWNLVKSQG